MSILVTGAAGFIGSHLCLRLLDNDEQVIGVDNLNDYYDVALKQARLSMLEGQKGFDFYHADISDEASISNIFKSCSYYFLNISKCFCCNFSRNMNTSGSCQAFYCNP